jgi:hypothetical protein
MVVELSWAGMPVSSTMQVAMHRNAVSNSSNESKAVLFCRTSTTVSTCHGWPPRSRAAIAFPLYPLSHEALGAKYIRQVNSKHA